MKTIEGGFPNQLVAPVQMHLFGKKLHQKDAEIPGEPIKPLFFVKKSILRPKETGKNITKKSLGKQRTNKNIIKEVRELFAVSEGRPYHIGTCGICIGL